MSTKASKVETISLFDQPTGPLTRATDPPTAQRAAYNAAGGNPEILLRIRAVVLRRGPISSFAIADEIRATTERWQRDTIITACSRSGLKRFDLDGESPGKRDCQRWALPLHAVEIEDTAPL